MRCTRENDMNRAIEFYRFVFILIILIHHFILYKGSWLNGVMRYRKKILQL